MTVNQLHDMLGDLEDTRELIIDAPQPEDGDDPLFLAWRSASKAARRALDRWRAGGGADAYAVYRALADQSDAAQDALEAGFTRLPRTA